MKKLFISIPMKGRTEEAIRHDMERMHKLAEVVFDQELEVIPTFVKHDPPETVNKSIYCLGKAIQKMAEADYFIGVDWCFAFKGCNIERSVAQEYGIPDHEVTIAMMPDALEIDMAARKAHDDKLRLDGVIGICHN